MTIVKCDHGIRLDRYCTDCEFDLLADRTAIEDRSLRMVWLSLVVGALIVLVALYVGSQTNR